MLNLVNDILGLSRSPEYFSTLFWTSLRLLEKHCHAVREKKKMKKNRQRKKEKGGEREKVIKTTVKVNMQASQELNVETIPFSLHFNRIFCHLTC